MDLELSGKRALVTGGSRGIGKAVARALAQEGADVAPLARRADALQAAAAELAAATGRRVIGVCGDTTDDDAVRQAVAEAQRGLDGTIDVLVNAAAARAAAQCVAAEVIEGQMAALNSIHQLVDAAEVAHVAAFLCSPKSRAINGDAIAAGGGAPRSIHC